MPFTDDVALGDYGRAWRTDVLLKEDYNLLRQYGGGDGAGLC